MRTLLPNEKKILESNGGIFTLTNQRVLQSDQNTDKSIMLEHISSIENIFSQNSFFKYGAFLTGFIAIGSFFGSITSKNFMRGMESFILTLILFVICVLIYFGSKKNELIIYSTSQGYIKIKVTGKSKQEVLSVIDKIEKAKSDRLSNLS